MPNSGLFSRSLLFALALTLGLASQAQAFTPEWKAGMTWTVATVYRNVQLGRPEPGQPAPRVDWSPPTNWVFYVARVENRKDGRYFLVQVKDREHKSSALASLVFASYDLPNGETAMTLLRGKFLRMIRGQRTVIDRADNEVGGTPRPVMHEASLIPYDFPSVPLIGPGSPARKRTFEITENAPPFKFAKDIVQEEQTGLDLKSWAGDDLEKRSGYKNVPGKDLIFVSLTRQLDGAVARQVWAKGHPWPIYAENTDSRSVLIYHSAESKPPTATTTK